MDHFEKEKGNWEKLGQEDALWAVVSHDGKMGKKWELSDFLSTGETDVANYHAILQKQEKFQNPIQHLLDFGCGVGRLLIPWSRRCVRVTGVDVSKAMVEKARENLRKYENVDIHLNQNPDLSIFADGTFDVVFSHICLQHIPSENVYAYITEFGRVCKEGGWVIFQMPASFLRKNWISELRRSVVELLPFGLSAWYRRWKSGVSVRFSIYFLSPEQVEDAAQRGGLRFVTKFSDASAGEGIESYIYLFQK